MQSRQKWNCGASPFFRIYCQGIYLSKTFSTYGIKLPPSQTLKRSCDLRVILGALPILILPCAITPGVVPTMKRWPHFPSLVLCMEVDLEATRSQIHDFQIQQKNALAFFLIAHGADIQECVRFIDGLLRGAGPEAISAILGMKHHAKKWDGLVQLGESLNIPIPDIVTKVDKARKRAQNKFQEQAKMLELNLPVELLKLQDGFLQNADETSCVQLQKVAPNSSGVVLARFSDAKPWLDNGSSITQDELSLIVIGRCHHDVPEECEKIKVPVLLNEEPLVVSGCLHHLGSKKAVISVDEHPFPVHETQVISVTAFKDEIHEETWKQLVRHPVKCILQILASEAGEIELFAPPWGRSYQKFGKKCDAELSSSVQIHIRVARAEFRRILIKRPAWEESTAHPRQKIERLWVTTWLSG